MPRDARVVGSEIIWTLPSRGFTHPVIPVKSSGAGSRVFRQEGFYNLKKSRFTDSRIVDALKRAQAGISGSDLRCEVEPGLRAVLPVPVQRQGLRLEPQARFANCRWPASWYILMPYPF